MKKLIWTTSMFLLLFAPTSHYLYGVDTMQDNSSQTVSPTWQDNSSTGTMYARDVMKSDSDVKSAVNTAFVADSRTAAEASNVDVKVDKGVVTLSGSVSTDKVKSDFGTVASGVAGVSSVVNNLTFTVK